jgi:hypothetical protein
MSRRTQPAHVADAGLAWASVTDTHGRQYFTDEFNHRVVVEDLSGRTWTFGTPGRGAGDLRFPRGLAIASHQTLAGTRVFVADTWNHRVQVFDATGRPLFAFGGFGTGDGQLSAPADLAIATLELPWEGDRRSPETAQLLVVADQWNARLQVFTLDGIWLATLGGRHDGVVNRSAAGETNPFFRTGAVGVPRDPVRLQWQGPWLRVTGGNGRTHQIDLATALLPTLNEWVVTAPAGERAHARRYFALVGHGRRALPAEVVQALSVA